MATEEQKETLQEEVTTEETVETEETTDLKEEVVEKTAEELLQEQIEKLQEEVKASEDNIYDFTQSLKTLNDVKIKKLTL